MQCRSSIFRNSVCSFTVHLSFGRNLETCRDRGFQKRVASFGDEYMYAYAGHLWQIGGFLSLHETPRSVELGTAGTILIPSPDIVVGLFPCFISPSSSSSSSFSFSPFHSLFSCQILLASLHSKRKLYLLLPSLLCLFPSHSFSWSVLIRQSINTFLARQVPTPAAANPFPKQKQKQTKSFCFPRHNQTKHFPALL